MIERQLRIIGAVLCLALFVQPAAAFDFSSVQERISQFTLANGLTFIVMEDHSAPVATFVTYADVGSVDDPKGATGMAHLFEHMAFKGTSEVGTTDAKKEKKALEKVDEAFQKLRTELLKGMLADTSKVAEYRAELKSAQEEAGAYVVPNGFGQIIETEGGVGLNAFTASDQTVYFFSLPANKAELWFALESGRFYDPVMREFYKEKDVVMEERRMRVESSPIGKLIEDFLGAGFKAHPYGVSGVGHMSDLEMIRREEAEEFFRTYYVPSNLVIAIVGDVEPAEVEKLAKMYFGRVPSAPKPSNLGTVEPPQLGERRVVIEDKAQPFYIVGYHRPPESDKDEPALAALADYIGQGRTSVLYKKLVKQEKLAVDVAAITQFPGNKYPTMFALYAVPSKGITAEQCEEAIMAEIEKVKETPISAEELEKVKARAKANFIGQLTSRDGMAIQLAGYQTLYGDWRAMFKQLNKINAVTAEDIQRVAKQYLTRTNRTTAYIETIEES